MNIQEYISSGIVECYVLGLATAEEAAEFERLCRIYPELAAERNRFELELENHALANSIEAPPSIGPRLINMIDEPAKVLPGKTININNGAEGYIPKNNIKRYLVAASVVVLAGLGYMFYSLQVQNTKLKNINQQLQAKYLQNDSALNSLVAAKKMLKNDNLSLVEMKTGAGEATANIYWDSTSSAVYMVVRSLPPLPQDRQYQLWALIDGKPKNLGVFDATSNNVILKMKDCKNAEAFSITVEPRGGNTAPSTPKAGITGKAKSL